MKQKWNIKLFKHIPYVIIIGFAFFCSAALFSQSLTDVDPDEGMQGQILELTISGQNTNFLQATNVSVTLRQGTETIIYTQEITFATNETLYATFGFSFNNDPGLYDLRVYEEPDGEMMLQDAFEIIENPDQPELINVTPNSAETGQTLDVLITGQFTHFQASTTTILFHQGSNTIYPQYNQIISNTQISAHFSFSQYHSPGVYDVSTSNYLDGTLTLPYSFTLLPGVLPSIQSMQPSSGMVGDLIEFNIYGTNTHFEDASSIVAYFLTSSSQTVFLEFDIINNELLQGHIILPYTAQTGFYELYIWNSIDGELVLPTAFFVYPNPDTPEINTIEPDSCYLDEIITIEIETQNTWFEWVDNITVWMNKSGSSEMIGAQSIEVVNNEKLIAEFFVPETAPAGYWDFNIYDDIDGVFSLEGEFMIIDTITGIKEQNKSLLINIFPNPSTGRFKISSANPIGDCSVIIYNLTGQRKEFKNVTFIPNQPVQFNIENLTKGFYFVQIITKQDIIIKKLIKN